MSRVKAYSFLEGSILTLAEGVGAQKLASLV